MRSVWGTFPEYHTSADNLEFITPQSLAQSFSVCSDVFEVLENNFIYKNLAPFCEPQLGKRGLYHATGGNAPDLQINARLWVLNLSDGTHSLLDIAQRSGIPFTHIKDAAALLLSNSLLERVCPA
jgi:aminopeptidase-like protein